MPVTAVKSLIENTRQGSSLLMSHYGNTSEKHPSGMKNLLRLSVRSNLSPSKTYLNKTLHASILEVAKEAKSSLKVIRIGR